MNPAHLNTTANAVVSFGVIADLQYADADPFKNRYFRNAPEKLRQAIRIFNGERPDFVVNLGDMIDHELRSFDGILPLFKQINSPVYHILGNHDYEVTADQKEHMHTLLGIQKYYYFQVKGWRFVVLDGNEISTFANLEGTPKYREAKQKLRELEYLQKPNAMFWNGGLSGKQFEWLKGVLDEARDAGEKVIIFCHYPVYPPDKHNLWNDDEIHLLFKKYCHVKLWLSGHNHHGNYGQYGDVHFVNAKGMVEGETEFACCICHLYEKNINITGYGTEISANLSIS